MTEVNNTDAKLNKLMETVVKLNEEIAKLKKINGGERIQPNNHITPLFGNVVNKPFPIRNIDEKIKKVDLNKLNNILRASDISIMTDVEIDNYSDYVFNTEKSYFDAIYELIKIRKEPKDAMKRFRDYAEPLGFIYKDKSDTVWVIGGG